MVENWLRQLFSLKTVASGKSFKSRYKRSWLLETSYFCIFHVRYCSWCRRNIISVSWKTQKIWKICLERRFGDGCDSFYPQNCFFFFTALFLIPRWEKVRECGKDWIYLSSNFPLFWSLVFFSDAVFFPFRVKMKVKNS